MATKASDAAMKAAQSLGMTPEEVQSKLDSGNYSLGYNPGDGGAESGVTTPESWNLQPTNPTVLWADKLGMTMDQVNKLNSTPEGQAQWNSMVTQAEDKQAHADDGPLGLPAGMVDAAALFTAWLTAGSSLGGTMTAGETIPGAGLAADAGASATAATAAPAAAGATTESGGGIINTSMGEAPALTGGPMPSGVTPGGGVEAINNAAPGAVTKGLSDAELAGLGLASAGGAAAGSAAGSEAGAAPSTTEATNAAMGNGAGAATQVETDASTLDSIMSWAHAHPQLAASLLTTSGLVLAGAAKGAADYETMIKKNELDQQALLEIAKQKPMLYQQFVQASSAGGQGVTMGVKAPNRARTLNTTSGQPVFGQGGIIGSRIGG